MNKRIAAWVVGGLVTISVSGLGFNQTIANAAERTQQMPMLQSSQMGNMDPKAMIEMMKSPEMQKQCIEMMKNPEMQKAMKDIMRTPEMQGIMKQMLEQDMGFHQMMSDLVNSVDMSSDHSMPQQQSELPQNNAKQTSHNAHHQ